MAILDSIQSCQCPHCLARSGFLVVKTRWAKRTERYQRRTSCRACGRQVMFWSDREQTEVVEMTAVA